MGLAACFYHPKNHLNLHDAASIAASLGLQLYVVPRPGADYKLDLLPPAVRRRLVTVGSLAEAARRHGGPLVVVETYGRRYITEVAIPPDALIVVGAEDYGVPPEALQDAPVAAIVRLPTAVQGMSYNVVASLVMALYEAATYGGRRSPPLDENEDVFIYSQSSTTSERGGGRGS